MAKKTKRERIEPEDYEPKVLKQLVGSLETALGEEADEIEELLDVSAFSGTRGMEKRHRLYIVIGILALLFSIIGIISTIAFSGRVIHNIANQTALKDELQKYVYPVVITDPPEFESNKNIPPSTVVSSAIWRIIISGETEHYEQEMGMITIPAVDVEYSARSLFGTGFEIVHQSIDDIEVAFDYYSETNSYVVPAQIRHMTYTPLIEKVSNAGEVYTLSVAYVAPNPLSVAGIENANTPVKNMIYTVLRSENKMTIDSIKYASTNPSGENNNTN